MDGAHSGIHGAQQEIAALLANRSSINSAHMVNSAPAGLDQQSQRRRDSAVVEAQLHLSTLGEDISKSDFVNQDRFPTARHIINGQLDSSQLTTCFENSRQSSQYLERLNAYDQNRAAGDDTIPSRPEYRRALVGILVQAFKSTALAKDKPKYVDTFNDKTYDNRLVEAQCWQILDACFERSQKQSLLRQWGGDKTKSESMNVRDMQFAERFDGIVSVLSHWKKSCDRIYQAPFLPQLVDNPGWAAKQTVANALSNGREAVLLDIAKQAEGDGEEQVGSPATSPSPTKRRKTVATPSSSRRGRTRTQRSSQITDLPPPPFPPLPKLAMAQSAPSMEDIGFPNNLLPKGHSHDTHQPPTIDQAPLSRVVPGPRLSTSHSFSSFNDSLHTFDRYNTSAVSTPTKHPTHNIATPPYAAFLQHNEFQTSAQSSISDHGFSTIGATQHFGSNNFDTTGTTILANAHTPYNMPTTTRSTYLTNTVSNLEPFLDLGTWQHDWSTDISPITTTTADFRHDLNFPSSGHGYNQQPQPVAPAARAHVRQEHENPVQPQEPTYRLIGTGQGSPRVDAEGLRSIQANDEQRLYNQHELQQWDQKFPSGHMWAR